MLPLMENNAQDGTIGSLECIITAIGLIPRSRQGRGFPKLGKSCFFDVACFDVTSVGQNKGKLLQNSAKAIVWVSTLDT